MPQSTPQKNRQSMARPVAPKPLPDVDNAETADHEYALVSVLYHALQGVQACEQYIDDAERAGDEDLIQFFQECRDEQSARATRAKQLLAGVMDVEDEVDEDDDEDAEDDDATDDDATDDEDKE
jgi:hypothetical protein